MNKTQILTGWFRLHLNKTIKHGKEKTRSKSIKVVRTWWLRWSSVNFCMIVPRVRILILDMGVQVWLWACLAAVELWLAQF